MEKKGSFAQQSPVENQYDLLLVATMDLMSLTAESTLRNPLNVRQREIYIPFLVCVCVCTYRNTFSYSDRISKNLMSSRL